MQTPVTWKTVCGHTRLPLSISAAAAGRCAPNFQSNIPSFAVWAESRLVRTKHKTRGGRAQRGRLSGCSCFPWQLGQEGLRAGTGGLAHPLLAGAGGTPGFPLPLASSCMTLA